MIKTSKSCDLNFANSGRDTEAKTSPRHLNFLKQLNKTAEMLYSYISGHPMSAPQYCNRANRSHNNHKFEHSLRRFLDTSYHVHFVIYHFVPESYEFVPTYLPLRTRKLPVRTNVPTTSYQKKYICFFS